MTTRDELSLLRSMGRIDRRGLIKGAAALGALGAAEGIFGRSARAATPKTGTARRPVRKTATRR